MYYAIKENDCGCDIVRGKDKNKLEEIIINYDHDGTINDCYVEDCYIEKVYEYYDIEEINRKISNIIYYLYRDFRICDINTYKAYEDNELFSRILLVDKKHLIVLLSLLITVDNELAITNYEVIKEKYGI